MSCISKKILKNMDLTILFLVISSIGVFILYPVMSVILTSLFDHGKFSLKYYGEIFSKSNLKLIKNSLWVSTISSLFTLLFAFCISLYIFVAKHGKRIFIQNILLFTMISPPFVSALAFIMLFGRRGIITYGLLGLSVNPYGWQGIVIMQVIGNISFATLLLMTSFDAINLNHILASRDLGTTPFEALVHIVIPSLKNGLLSVVFILFTMNLADFGTPIVIGGRYKVLATEAYLKVISTPDLGRACAISVLMIPTAFLAFYFYQKTLSKSDNISDGSKSFSESGYDFELPDFIIAVLTAVIIVFLTIMSLKYINILLNTISNTATGRIKFTTKYFYELPRSIRSSFLHSLYFSFISAFLASLIGILLSYYTHRRKIFGMKCIEFIASLPYIIPGTFWGLGYVAAFSHGPVMLRGTMAIIILNLTFRQISVSNKLSNAAFFTMDQKLELAAKDLGAGNVEILFGIILPILRPVFITSFITIFTSSMTAVGAIIFLISPGKNVASAELFQAVENGRYGAGSVIAVVLIFCVAAINMSALYILEKYRIVSKGGERLNVPAIK